MTSVPLVNLTLVYFWGCCLDSSAGVNSKTTGGIRFSIWEDKFLFCLAEAREPSRADGKHTWRFGISFQFVKNTQAVTVQQTKRSELQAAAQVDDVVLKSAFGNNDPRAPVKRQRVSRSV